MFRHPLSVDFAGLARANDQDGGLQKTRRHRAPPDDITDDIMDGTSYVSSLLTEAQKGLAQIDEKMYVHGLRQEGYESILCYSIAFHKKSCEVLMV